MHIFTAFPFGVCYKVSTATWILWFNIACSLIMYAFSRSGSIAYIANTLFIRSKHFRRVWLSTLRFRCIWLLLYKFMLVKICIVLRQSCWETFVWLNYLKVTQNFQKIESSGRDIVANWLNGGAFVWPDPRHASIVVFLVVILDQRRQWRNIGPCKSAALPRPFTGYNKHIYLCAHLFIIVQCS